MRRTERGASISTCYWTVEAGRAKPHLGRSDRREEVIIPRAGWWGTMGRTESLDRPGVGIFILGRKGLMSIAQPNGCTEKLSTYNIGKSPFQRRKRIHAPRGPRSTMAMGEPFSLISTSFPERGNG